MNQLTECPLEHLQAYLDDTLDAALHDQLLNHLDQCAACRERLESNAGSANDWRTARQALMECDFGTEGNYAKLSLTDSLTKSRNADPLSLLKMLTPSDDPRAAGRIGPFEITGIVGSGGMGLVLKARDPALDRFVAIKILAPHLAASQTARKRFAREARAAAAVIHDNVIAIYQVAEWNELPYLVMPYLPDPSLQQRIDDCGRLDLEAMFAGRPPVDSELGSETIQQIAGGQVPKLSFVSTDAPDWLVKIVDWLHQAKPADRPESATQVAEWLEQSLAFVRQPTEQSLPAALLPTPKFKPNGVAIRLWLAAALAISLVALVYPILLIRKSLVNPKLTNQAASTPTESSADISLLDRSSRSLPDKNAKPTFDAETDSTRTTHLDWLGDEIEIEAITRESQTVQASINKFWQIQPVPIVPAIESQSE